MIQLRLIAPKRDTNPSNDCDLYDGRGYNGRGDCRSDGHYACLRCSRLAPTAPRFTETDVGRGERLRLFWARPERTTCA